PALALAVALTLLRPSPFPSPIAHNPAPAPPVQPEPPLGEPPDPIEQPLAAVMRHANFKIVEAPPSARIITSAPANVRIISDEELIEALRAAGHDVGLIRTPDRVILTDNTPDDESSRAPERPTVRKADAA